MKFNCVIVAAAIGLGASAALADVPTVYPQKDVYGRVADVTLSAYQKKHYRAFRKIEAYFGAFYAAQDGEASYFTYSYHDLNTAKAVAKRGCEAIAAGPCQFVAVAVPEGVDPNAVQASGLGHITGRDFQGVYRDMQTTDGYGAFAVSGTADHGYSYGWPNAEEARATAIAYCKAEVAKELTNVRIKDRVWAKANGLTKCTVIDTYAPGGN